MNIEFNRLYAIKTNAHFRDLLGEAYSTFRDVYQRGMTVRQIKRAMFKAGAPLSDDVAEKLGNFLNRAEDETISAMFHQCVWWSHTHLFGDSSSCFFGSRATAIPALVEHGAWFVTWWRKQTPVGRSIMMWFDDVLTSPLIPVDVNGLVVFNTYSSLANTYEETNIDWCNRDAAYALADFFGYSHVQRHVNVLTSQDFGDTSDFYLNSRVLWSVSTRPIDPIEYLNETPNQHKIQIQPVCTGCGHALPSWESECLNCGSEHDHKLRTIPSVYELEDIVFYDLHPLTGKIVERRGRVDISESYRPTYYRVNPTGDEEPCWKLYTPSLISVARENNRWVRLYRGEPITELPAQVVDPSRLWHPQIDAPLYVASLDAFLAHTCGVYDDGDDRLKIGGLRWFDEVSVVTRVTETLYYHESSEVYYRMYTPSQFKAVGFLSDGQEVSTEDCHVTSLRDASGKHEYYYYPPITASVEIHNKFWRWAFDHAPQLIERVGQLDKPLYQYIYRLYYERSNNVRPRRLSNRL